MSRNKDLTNWVIKVILLFPEGWFKIETKGLEINGVSDSRTVSLHVIETWLLGKENATHERSYEIPFSQLEDELLKLIGNRFIERAIFGGLPENFEGDPPYPLDISFYQKEEGEAL